MSGKQQGLALGGPRSGGQAQSTLGSAWSAVVSPDNRSIVTAIGVFAAGIAFLHSGMGEILLPPSV